MSKNKLRLVPTNLPGHFTFEPPPDGFRLTSATDEELLRYGMPHRPDPKKFPEAARHWIRAMSSIKKFVTPELVVQSAIADVSSTDPNWSGLVVDQPGAFDVVWGSWIVPTVTVPQGAGTVMVPGSTVSGGFSWFPYHSSMWVGLFDPPSTATGTGSLLQAGTWHDATLTLGLGGDPSLGLVTTSYFAWLEWFPGPSVRLNGFTVEPGQEVMVAVLPLFDLDDPAAANGPGLVQMVNFSTGTAITPIVVFIPTVDFRGDAITPQILGLPTTILGLPSTQAVWILERPSYPIKGVVSISALADYGTASFVGGGALVKGTNAVTIGANDQGTLMNMLANDGSTVLSTATETPQLQLAFTGGPAA